MSDQQQTLYDLVMHISDYPEQGQLLRQKRDSVPTIRAATGEGQNVVIKYFRHPGLGGCIRRLLKIHSAGREWTGLTRMTAQGARVPRPLAYFHLKDSGDQSTHAVVTSDLGYTVRGSDYLEQLLQENDHAGVQRLNQDLIDATTALLAADLLDGDHTLMNFAIAEDGRAYRLDFECARHIRNVIRHTNWYAETLGRLIATYAFNSHCHDGCAAEFVGQLFEATRPSQTVLDATRRRVDEMIDVHNRHVGDDARIALSW